MRGEFSLWRIEKCEKVSITVLDYLTEYGEMSDEDLQELLNVKKTRAYLLTRQMHENGPIQIVGRGAEKKYKLK